jgi:hypothetical protein
LPAYRFPKDTREFINLSGEGIPSLENGGIGNATL